MLGADGGVAGPCPDCKHQTQRHSRGREGREGPAPAPHQQASAAKTLCGQQPQHYGRAHMPTPLLLPGTCTSPTRKVNSPSHTAIPHHSFTKVDGSDQPLCTDCTSCYTSLGPELEMWIVVYPRLLSCGWTPCDLSLPLHISPLPRVSLPPFPCSPALPLSPHPSPASNAANHVRDSITKTTL